MLYFLHHLQIIIIIIIISNYGYYTNDQEFKIYPCPHDSLCLSFVCPWEGVVSISLFPSGEERVWFLLDSLCFIA